LIGLTGAAGTVDALGFLYLGKVFISFQSGNVLFLGLGAGTGNGGLVIRAAAVLAVFFLGAAAGSRLIGMRLRPGQSPRTELRVLGLEVALLAAFAAVWLAVGTPDQHHVLRVVLLALGAAAMGVQVAFVLALKIPNVATVAVTATLANLAQRAGDRENVRDPDAPPNVLLVGLLLTYVVCAFGVAVLPETPALAFAPLTLVVAAVAVESRQLGLRTAFTTPPVRRSKLS
jgi:uncharacterized membrane protein YoaK (UPF0700 family)